MRKTRISCILAIVVAALMLTQQPSYAQSTQTLTVFAASSLTDAFKAVETAFEAAHTGVDVMYSFASSSALATQLKEGAPADIFASANLSQMNVVRDAQRLASAPLTFAKNRLVLIVPTDNPAQITSLKDLAKPGVKLIVASPKVPVREYTDAMLDKLAKVSGYGEEYKAAVLNNIVSEEDNVRQVSAKIALGEADAGIVYRTDVTPDLADKVIALPIPDAVNTLAIYPIAIINDSINADLAQSYIDYLLSVEGQQILIQWNFISVVIPSLPPTIALAIDGALHVTGQVLNPLKLTVDDLKNNYPSHTVKVTYLSSETPISTSFTGVYLRDILDSTQLNLNADVKNDKLGLFIVATGADGYQVVFAYGEIDPAFADQPILVAYAQDGQPISDKLGSLRLVVPPDKQDGRYVNGLVSLDVRHAPSIQQ